MGLLLFRTGGQRYALETHLVERVLPMVELRPLPQLPFWLAGLLDYRGQPLPVVELCRLVNRRDCRDSYSSRIILVRYPAPPPYPALLGLLAEEVTAMAEAGTVFKPSGLATPETPYLDGLATLDRELVQRVVVEQLLPEEVRARLFPGEVTP